MARNIQRIRDPLHNLIEFDLNDELEGALWKVVQSAPFQRLRRIRQLGFSEFIYPGATHTRFSHSLGVFFLARQLMSIMLKELSGVNRPGLSETNMKQALAAALLHDVGHGMFSHAFEEIGKKRGLLMAQHEHVSAKIIQESEISDILQSMGSGFADDVASIIKGSSKNSYSAIVSSQFDADRLDYLQRDMLMTGAQSGRIDFTWLLNNLKVKEIPYGKDEHKISDRYTFVLDHKAIHAAEMYVLSLFHLYPTVYFHKATRGAEKVFSALIEELFELIENDKVNDTNLPVTHPLVVFILDPKSLESALQLDDFVFWGALPLLASAKNEKVAIFAKCLLNRNLPKSIDVDAIIKGHDLYKKNDDPRVFLTSKLLDIEEVVSNFKNDGMMLFLDRAKRSPYKDLAQSKGVLEQINILMVDDEVEDIFNISSAISAIPEFTLFRIYYFYENDKDKLLREIENIIGGK